MLRARFPSIQRSLKRQVKKVGTRLLATANCDCRQTGQSEQNGAGLWNGAGGLGQGEASTVVAKTGVADQECDGRIDDRKAATQESPETCGRKSEGAGRGAAAETVGRIRGK